MLKKKIQCNVDVAYLYGLQEHTHYGNITRKDCKMYAASLHLSVLYNFSDAIAVGAGFGLDGYHDVDYNTLPIFITAKYSPIKKCRNAFIFTELGKGIGSDNFSKGTMFDLGVGYELKTGKNFGVTFRLGYNLRSSDAPSEVDLSEYGDSPFIILGVDDVRFTRHSIIAGVGISF